MDREQLYFYDSFFGNVIKGKEIITPKQVISILDYYTDLNYDKHCLEIIDVPKSLEDKIKDLLENLNILMHEGQNGYTNYKMAEFLHDCAIDILCDARTNNKISKEDYYYYVDKITITGTNGDLFYSETGLDIEYGVNNSVITNDIHKLSFEKLERIFEFTKDDIVELNKELKFYDIVLTHK